MQCNWWLSWCKGCVGLRRNWYKLIQQTAGSHCPLYLQSGPMLKDTMSSGKGRDADLSAFSSSPNPPLLCSMQKGWWNMLEMIYNSVIDATYRIHTPFRDKWGVIQWIVHYLSLQSFLFPQYMCCSRLCFLTRDIGKAGRFIKVKSRLTECAG